MVSIQCRQPLAQVAESHAIARSAGNRRALPRPVSVTLTVSESRVAARDDGDRAAIGRRFHAMLDGIFHERDKEIRRKRMLLEFGRHIEGESEARAHARLQDVEIGGRKVDFLPSVVETGAQLRQAARR